MANKLDSIFGKYKSEDLVFDVYRSYLHDYKMTGLTTTFLVSQFFSTLKKEYVLLPLNAYLGIVKGGKLLPESVPQKAPEPPKNLLEEHTLRSLQRHYFILMDEDVVEFTVSKGNDVIIKTQGMVKDIVIDTALIKQKNYAEGTMAVFNIKLLTASPSREKQEQKSFFGNYQDYLVSLQSTEYQQKFLKLIVDESLLKKRLELYNAQDIEDISGIDFGSRNGLQIQMILSNLNNPYLSNEDLIKINPSVEIKELEKMRDWIKRDLGDHYD